MFMKRFIETVLKSTFMTALLIRANIEGAQEHPFAFLGGILQYAHTARLSFGTRIVGSFVKKKQVQIGLVVIRRQLKGMLQVLFGCFVFLATDLNRRQLDI